MTENLELRQEMEDYVKQHDLMRLFERLATSIMYDRPGAFLIEVNEGFTVHHLFTLAEDLNQYAADWLTKIKNARPQVEHVSSSVSLSSRASGSSSVKPRSNTSVPETRDSVLTQDSQNSLHSTRSKGFRPGRVSDSQPKVVVEPGSGRRRKGSVRNWRISIRTSSRRKLFRYFMECWIRWARASSLFSTLKKVGRWFDIRWRCHWEELLQPYRLTVSVKAPQNSQLSRPQIPFDSI